MFGYDDITGPRSREDCAKRRTDGDIEFGIGFPLGFDQVLMVDFAVVFFLLMEDTAQVFVGRGLPASHSMMEMTAQLTGVHSFPPAFKRYEWGALNHLQLARLFGRIGPYHVRRLLTL